MVKFAVVGLWIFAWSLWPLPPFDIQAAIWVGGAAIVVSAVVIGLAIAIPAIAIGGTLSFATAVSVAGVSLVVGVVCAGVAGLISGHIGDVKLKDREDKIKKISNQLHIKFEPIKGIPNNAKPFECTIITYIEEGIGSKSLSITQKKLEIKETDAADFYSLIERQINFWQAEKVLGDSDNLKRRIIVYMDPFPGDSVFSRIAEIAKKVGTEKFEIEQIFGPWKSAAADLP
jgi:hypothetical protein